MKDKILDLLKKTGKALKFEDIDSSLEINTIEETKELSDTLNSLVKDGEVYFSNKGKYMLFSFSNLRKGVLSVNKRGYGFVRISDDEEDVFISRDDIKDAVEGDTVICEITLVKDDGRREGRILRVLKRGISEIVGEAYFKKGI